VEVKEKKGNSIVLRDHKLVYASECGEVNCSTTFHLSPGPDERLTHIFISVLATDTLLKHNSTEITFERPVGKQTSTKFTNVG